MVDVKKLIEIADSDIERLLTILGLDWKHEGEWIVMPCCFHGGTHDNLRYRNLSFYCFSHCQRGFSIINVVQKVLDLEFLDAVQWLCTELGIADNDLKVDQKRIAVKNKLNKLKSMKTHKHEVMYTPVSQDILNDIERFDHPYMLDQGFKPSTLEHFNIGYARGGFFTNRITFPIDAPDGSIISISGRLPNADQLGLPKYKILNGSANTDTLYNISRINKELDYIIVVEGFKSVMSLYEWGFENCVALMGAFLSRNQCNILLGLGKHIICIGDNDQAGKRMAQSVYNQCYRFAKVTKIDLGEFTDIEKASPCETDLGFDDMCDLVECIENIIKE